MEGVRALRCKQCGKEMIENKIGRKKTFCCEECRRAYHDVPIERKIKTCKHCGKNFKGTKSTKYCSKECRIAYREENPKYKLVCEYCGKEFRSNNKKQEFCSVQCSNAHNNPIKNEERRIHPQAICKQCGKKFNIQPTEGRINMFCSLECYRKWTKINEVPYRKKQCETCGKTYTPTSGGQRYCSKECNPKLQEETYVKICDVCGSIFISTIKTKVVCSEKCRKEYNRRYSRNKAKITYYRTMQPYTCVVCGKLFVPAYGDKTRIVCSDECRDIRRKDIRAKERHRRRMHLESNGGDSCDPDITLTKVIDLHNGKCAICGEQCDREDCTINKEGYFIVGASYPTIDHVVPISKGGTHTWDNIQLTCHLCNSIKNDNIDVNNKEITLKKEMLLEMQG